MLTQGRGVARDEMRAAVLFRRAADLGYASRVERDDAQAVAWYRKSAAQGNEMAKSNLRTLDAD